MKYLFLVLRPQQWVKNFFIFLPLFFGKKFFVFPTNFKTVIAFILFSITASVVYLLNDIIDIEEDKSHPTKRFRAIASGKVSKHKALLLVYLFGILSVALSFVLNIYFGWVVMVYLIFNIIYSKILKQVVIIDVFCIGFSFYYVSWLGVL